MKRSLRHWWRFLTLPPVVFMYAAVAIGYVVGGLGGAMVASLFGAVLMLNPRTAKYIFIAADKLLP